MNTQPASFAVVGAVVLLLAGCGKEPVPAPPPAPQGPAIDQVRAIAEATDRARKDAAKLEARVSELEEKVESLRKKVEGAGANGESQETAQKHLDEFRTGWDTKPVVPAADIIKGIILAADSANDIYLISVGKKDGVKVADEFIVYRGDAFVAVVVVDSVFENKASVVVKKVSGKAMKKSDIKTGDKVSSSLL